MSGHPSIVATKAVQKEVALIEEFHCNKMEMMKQDNYVTINSANDIIINSILKFRQDIADKVSPQSWKLSHLFSKY